MHFQKLAIICITVALLAAVTLADKGKGKGKKGWKGGKGMWKNMTCKGEAMPKNEDVWSVKKECKQEFMPATEEPLPEDKDKKREVMKERMKKLRGNTCIDVCVQKKNGVLSDDGTLSTDGLEKHIKAVIPEKAQTEMIAAYQTCYDDSFKSAAPSMDNNCESYKEFKKCTKTAFFKVCEIEMPKWGKGKKGDKKGEDAADEAAPEATPEGEGSMEAGPESESASDEH